MVASLNFIDACLAEHMMASLALHRFPKKILADRTLEMVVLDLLGLLEAFLNRVVIRLQG
jgi:hypothetical protein